MPTTMPFLVRGKSVDFRNREGSSPSIPPKRPRWLPKHFCLFFRQRFQIRYLSHSLDSFTNGFEQKSFSLTLPHSEKDYICTNEHIWTRNPHYGIIHSPYRYPYTTKGFFLKIQEIPVRFKQKCFLSPFNWHRSRSSSRMMHRGWSG